MDRRDFFKKTSAFVLFAVGAATGMSRVFAETTSLATRGYSGRTSDMSSQSGSLEYRNLGGFYYSTF